jgi:ribosomal protein S18 acetylase RimI-like enzyme
MRQRYPESVVEIRQLTAEDARPLVGDLAEVLLDCVDGGASVGFMSLNRPRAEEFFRQIVSSLEQGSRLLLAAFVGSTLVGTVQIVTAMPENQPHRAEIAKLLVHRSARGQGVAAQLMQHAERAAFAAGKTLLVLDTCSGGAAERLYSRLGWTKAGVIPHYALFPDGGSCDTVVFWKSLR